MQILSHFLLTSCLLPVSDAAATSPLASWGALQPLSPPAAALACDGLQGLRAAGNETTAPTGPLLQSARSLPMDAAVDDPAAPSVWAMELWVLPTEPSSDQTPMLTIGDPSRLSPTQDPGIDGNVNNDDDRSHAAANDDYCRGLDLELLTYRGHFLLRFRSEGVSCNTVYLSSVPLVPDQLTQLVVAFERHANGTDALSVFVDGQVIDRNVALDIATVAVSGASNASVVKSWNPRSVLWLFGNPSRPRPFGGSLAQVSFHGAGAFDPANGRDDSDIIENEETLEQWVEGLYRRGVVRDRPLPLAAVPAGTVRLDQDDKEPQLISVRSTPESTSSFRVSMKVITVPKHGQLLRLGKDEGGKVGDVWSFPVKANDTDQPLTFRYRLNSVDYFNTPSINAYGDNLQLAAESFRYRLIAHDASGRKLAVSPTVTQAISVVHVNHPPHLSGPTSIDPTNIHGGTAVVNGIVLKDADRDFNMDRVRVDVWSSMGYVTLSAQDRSRADFQSCRGRSDSSWQCTGTGIRDRAITFVAIPDDVARILGGLEYEAIMAGQDDRIVVRVWDGAGGECLSTAEHLRYHEGSKRGITSHRGCFEATLKIHVPGLSLDSDQNSHRHRGFLGTKVNFARLLFWVLVLSIATCCCCCLRRRLPLCLARGGKIEVDEVDGSVARVATVAMDGYSV